MPLIEVPPPSLRPDGASPDVPLARVAGQLDGDNVIGTDVPCRRCGYNLRGLRAEAKCPECALSVWPSLRPGLVGFGEPRFIDSLRYGALLLMVGSATVVGGAIVARRFGGVAPDVVLLCGVAASLLGCWALTAPDPSGLGESESGHLRRAARALLLVGVLVLPLGTLRNILATNATATSLLDVAAFLVNLGLIAGPFALLRYLRRLAFRLFEPVLARQMARLSYQVLFCAAGAFATDRALIATVRPIVPTLATFLFAVGAFAVILALVTTAQLAYACWRLSNELAAHARLARQSWPDNDAACAHAGGAGDEPPAP